MGEDGARGAHAPPELSEPAITSIRLFSIFVFGEGEGMVDMVWDRKRMGG